jgi:hypothetical protein
VFPRSKMGLGRGGAAAGRGADVEAKSSAGFDISSISAIITMSQYVKYFNSPDSVVGSVGH